MALPKRNDKNEKVTEFGTLIRQNLPSPGPIGTERKSSRLAYPNKLYAWNVFVHGESSSDAAQRVFSHLGNDLSVRWAAMLAALPLATMARDVTDAKNHDHETLKGQKHHFMRHGSQSEKEAYDAGLRWVEDEAANAAQCFKNWSNSSLSDVAGLDCAEHLGNSVHALQDSFSPAHVRRDKLDIAEIYVFAEQGGLEHIAKDLEYFDLNMKELLKLALRLITKLPGDVKLSALGEATRDATVALLRAVVQSVDKPNPKKHFCTVESPQLRDQYFRLSPEFLARSAKQTK